MGPFGIVIPSDGYSIPSAKYRDDDAVAKQWPPRVPVVREASVTGRGKCDFELPVDITRDLLAPRAFASRGGGAEAYRKTNVVDGWQGTLVQRNGFRAV